MVNFRIYINFRHFNKNQAVRFSGSPVKMLESGLKRVLDGFGVSSGAIMAKTSETAIRKVKPFKVRGYLTTMVNYPAPKQAGALWNQGKSPRRVGSGFTTASNIYFYGCHPGINTKRALGFLERALLGARGG
jgi:hypothetical protein